jgi:hypothetical protein
VSKASSSAELLPPSVARALRQLGTDLALARQRRKESLKAWALRMHVSVPTLSSLQEMADGHYGLSPAFDVVPTAQGLG